LSQSLSVQRMIVMACSFLFISLIADESGARRLRVGSTPKVRNWARLGCGRREARSEKCCEMWRDVPIGRKPALRMTRPSRAVALRA
jgi:hypothetical protein